MSDFLKGLTWVPVSKEELPDVILKVDPSGEGWEKGIDMEIVASNENTKEDWYTDALEELKDDGAEESGLSREQFDSAYAFLFNMGVIDYDVEKDILYDVYVDPDLEQDIGG